ncbi:hypothetical protein ACFWMU_08140 [Streptomyces sp. NPDC058357]|uniref:hypothetical protein n=1 Tax=Streptomyces sp. NPDC058357 TaxID=3346456 RepID=UPI00366168D9
MRDALVHLDPSMTLESLPPGSAVGTASIRRQAALLRVRPDILPAPLRGPADARLLALDSGEVDALILASSGLDRLGQTHRICERISPERLCPPLGAGIIALQCRNDDERSKAVAVDLGHRATTVQAIAERTLLQKMDGFCNGPLAGYCTTDAHGMLTLRGMVFSPDGATVIDVRRTGTDPAATALAVHRRLARHGAGDVPAPPHRGLDLSPDAQA